MNGIAISNASSKCGAMHSVWTFVFSHVAINIKLNMYISSHFSVGEVAVWVWFSVRMVCHDVLLSHSTWICMHAKTIDLISLYRMRKWSSLHCSPAPNANGVSLLVRQYADSHDIYANWFRSSLFAEIDLNNQSGLYLCYYHIPNTDGAVLTMLSLTGSDLCTTARGDRTGRVTADRTLKQLRYESVCANH